MRSFRKKGKRAGCDIFGYLPKKVHMCCVCYVCIYGLCIYGAIGEQITCHLSEAAHHMFLITVLQQDGEVDDDSSPKQ